MFKQIVVLVALVAVALGGVVHYESPLGAVLLPKVKVNPTQVTVVKQPITVEQTEHVFRQVPVPVRAVAYTAPHVVVPHVYAAPNVYTHYVL